MRPSNKSRSRNKGGNRRQQNPNNNANIVNRVFDSAGPEGKVRGTPQQIVEKYTQLARDAQLSGDRVAAESFMQHSEHYSRMLAVAQQEQAKKQAEHSARQAEQAEQQRQRNEQRAQQQAAQQQAAQPPQAVSEAAAVTEPEPAAQPEPAESGNLVETPENKPPRRKSRPRTRKPAVSEAAPQGVE